MTLNQFLKIFQTFASSHKQVNSHGEGDLIASNLGNTLYPLMWVIQQTGKLSPGALSIPVTVALLDLVKQDDSNLTEVQSDMLEVAKDLFAHLRNHPDLEVESVSFDFVKDKLGDEVAGVQLTLTASLDFHADRCAIPV